MCRLNSNAWRKCANVNLIYGIYQIDFLLIISSSCFFSFSNVFHPVSPHFRVSNCTYLLCVFNDVMKKNYTENDYRNINKCHNWDVDHYVKASAKMSFVSTIFSCSVHSEIRSMLCIEDRDVITVKKYEMFTLNSVLTVKNNEMFVDNVVQLLFPTAILTVEECCV